jgi:Phage tail lysozyme
MLRGALAAVTGLTLVLATAVPAGATSAGADRTRAQRTGSAVVRQNRAADPITANVATGWKYLLAHTSLTRVQIAGLEGNLLYESGGALDPAQVQFGCHVPPGPCGVGVAQWTDPGPRFSGLVALAHQEHVSWATLAVQLEFVWRELKATPGFGLAALQACATVSCAARVVEKEYERPGSPSTSCSDPTASYCARVADANEIFAAYGTPKSGYWMLGADGKVYAFGSASNSGSASGFTVAIAARTDGRGYWVVDGAGNVSHFGVAAGDHGGRPLLRSGESVSTISATPSGNGYWLFTTQGRAFGYGDAHFYGDMSGTTLNGPVIASAATATGRGYYMVGSDGGVFSFGDARFHGSTGNLRLNQPVVGISPAPDNRGYWLVASDGGVFAFGESFRGSMGGTRLNRPVNGLVAYGNGYLMVASDGGVFDFSDKAFLGSLAGNPPSASIVGIAAFTIA